MKTRVTRWYHKLFYRLSAPYRYDVEQALRTTLHRGIGIGLRQALAKAAGYDYPYDAPLPVVFCDQCGTQVLLADAIYCRRCGCVLPKATGPQPQIKRKPITGPTLHIPPGTFARAFHQSPGGIQTRLYAAINKAQLVGMTTQQHERAS